MSDLFLFWLRFTRRATRSSINEFTFSAREQGGERLARQCPRRVLGGVFSREIRTRPL